MFAELEQYRLQVIPRAWRLKFFPVLTVANLFLTRRSFKTKWKGSLSLRSVIYFVLRKELKVALFLAENSCIRLMEREGYYI